MVAGESWVFLGSRDGDLTSAAATRAIFERVRPTHVIHLAARVGGLFNNMRHKVEFFRDNCKINDNVMECCREFGVGRCAAACLSVPLCWRRHPRARGRSRGALGAR